MFTARFLQSTNRNLPHRSKLFARRAALRCPQVVPAQLPSELPDETVAPERAIALAIVDAMAPTCIQPSTGDLEIAGAEPDTEMPGAVVESATAPVADVIATETTKVKTSIADVPEKVPSAQSSKRKSPVKKRKTEVSSIPRRRRNSRSKSGSGESNAGAAEVSSQTENLASLPEK